LRAELGAAKRSLDLAGEEKQAAAAMATEQAAALERLRHELTESAQVSTRHVLPSFIFIIWDFFYWQGIFLIRDIIAVKAKSCSAVCGICQGYSLVQ
jgi:hypothetical protein